MRVSEDFILNVIEQAGIHPKDMRKIAVALFIKSAQQQPQPSALSNMWHDIKTSPRTDFLDFSKVQQLPRSHVHRILSRMNEGTASRDELKLLRRYYSDMRSRYFAPDYKHEMTQGMPDFMRSKQLNIPEKTLRSKEYRLYESLRGNPYLNPPTPSVKTYTKPYSNLDQGGFKKVLPWMQTTETPIELNLNPTKGGY